MATIELVAPFLRPRPPADLEYSVADGVASSFVPAPEVWSWIRAAFLMEHSPFYVEDHSHLLMADVGILWTNVENVKQMRTVVGTAEIPNTRGSVWQKAKAELQLRQWFGCVPDFVITLSAPYAAIADDASFGALVDHELFHCAQARDEFNTPRFNRETGRPIFAMRGHDVEQFVGVVRRWGVRAAGVESLVEAASHPPLIASATIAAACGTCLGKVA